MEQGTGKSGNNPTEREARVLVTGGCGFAGHHFVEHVLKNTPWHVVVLDRLTYASFGFDRLRDINVYNDDRVTVLQSDLVEPLSPGIVKEIGAPDYIVHMAAETHVDNSIADARPFVRANVMGTLSILEYARTLADLRQFVYFGTDEIFGPANYGQRFQEWDRYNSANPYAATKAGGEELAMAFANTYGVPVLATHTMNLFGERQHPEKFIPLVMQKVLAGEIVTIHADSAKEKAGSRYYIHARNVADALLHVFDRGQVMRDKLNIVGEREVDNLEMAQFIADTVGKPLNYEMVDFHGSRPGHDLRYALNGEKLLCWGWEHPKTFEQSLRKTIEWTLEHKHWLWQEPSYA